MNKPRLYVDGGVIHKNPSPYGGTWAWVLVDRDDRTMFSAMSGAFHPGLFKDLIHQLYTEVTNNQTEMFALLHGLLHLPAGCRPVVYSDSEITLGRIWDGWRWKGIPQLLLDWYAEVLRTIPQIGSMEHHHLDGHPTDAQLVSGIGRHGNPVSYWNRLCDDLCRESGEILVGNGTYPEIERKIR